MATFCFASYEIHPTTWGGAGVLIHHAARELIAAGHDVVMLLDVPPRFFQRFNQRDRVEYFHPERCRAYSVESLCDDLPFERAEIPSVFVWNAVRFDHALRKLRAREKLDFVELFEYCGVGTYCLARPLFEPDRGPCLGVRVHNSVELIDRHEATKTLDRDRYLLYALERRAMDLSEVLLVPSAAYAEAYCEGYYGLPKARMVEAPPPIAPFPRVERTKAVPEEIIFYGRIFEFKGVERLLQAGLQVLERRPEAPLRFVFIGPDSHDSRTGGSYTAFLRRRIPEAARDRFLFLGHLDHDEVSRRLENAVFAVFPNRFESFCYALHEFYDAGIALIAADIPAFRHVLNDERDALFYDGSVAQLVETMERLLDDPGLRKRLANHPPRVGSPVEPIYRGLPQVPEPEAQAPSVTAFVVVPRESSETQEEMTRTSASQALVEGDQLLIARECEGGGARFLGRDTRFETQEGKPLSPSKVLTRDAVWVVLAGDRPGEGFLDRCRLALCRAPRVAFTGMWTQSDGATLDAAHLDLCPELYPFEQGGRLTRVVTRTPPGIPINELFEPRLERYGEIGWIWRAISRWGPGVLLPEIGIQRSALDTAHEDSVALSFLLANDNDAERARRLALWNAARDRTPTGVPSGSSARSQPTQQEVFRLASEFLNGRTLFNIMARKFRAKIARLFGRGELP